MPGTGSNQHTAATRPITSWMKNYSRRQQFRRMAESLLAERDEIISDLGYDRREIIAAMHLPLGSDAITYLETHRSK